MGKRVKNPSFTPLQISSRCQIQLQRRAEATFFPGEAYTRRYMQYLSFPHWLCHANTWRRASYHSYGLPWGYNLSRRNESFWHPLGLEAKPTGALEQ